jgi:flagellar hook-length control protein FliK
VLDQLRAASQASSRADVPAAADSHTAPSAVAAGMVADALAPQAPASTTPPSAAAWLAGVQLAPQGQRASSDSGDAMPHFGSGGHAGPRLAAPQVAAPPVSTNFATLVSAMHTPDVLPAETTTQIVQAIRMQMLRDGGEAHIRLDPRQFGDMTVRIKVDQGQVTARVEADAPVVREWLQSNQHVLRQSLAGQQLTLDRLEVYEPPASHQGRRDESSARDDAREQRQQQRRRRPESGELFEVVA